MMFKLPDLSKEQSALVTLVTPFSVQGKTEDQTVRSPPGHSTCASRVGRVPYTHNKSINRKCDLTNVSKTLDVCWLGLEFDEAATESRSPDHAQSISVKDKRFNDGRMSRCQSLDRQPSKHCQSPDWKTLRFWLEENRYPPISRFKITLTWA